MQPISCRLSPGLLPSLLTASGAVKPPPPKKVTRHQNLVQLLQKSSLRFFTRRNLVQHQEGLTSNMYYWKPCCTSWCQLTLSLLVFHQRLVFSTLVQALHQFRILTGASSSQVLAKSHDGGGGCTKKSWVVPFHHQSWAAGLAAPEEAGGGRINELCRRRGQKFGWMA